MINLNVNRKYHVIEKKDKRIKIKNQIAYLLTIYTIDKKYNCGW
jgi:hypothetical protein